MKISVFNTKGGVGKTPIAVTLAKDLGLAYYTNEKNPLQKIDVTYINTEELDPNQKIEDNCIFDFGGFVSNIAPFLRISDLIIVPTFKSYLSISHAFSTIKAIKSINKNICMVLTRVANEDIDQVVDEINKYFKYPLFVLNESRIFDTVLEKGKGINELAEELYFYKGKKIIEQYQTFISGVTKLADQK